MIKLLCVKKESTLNPLLQFNDDSIFLHPSIISFFHKSDDVNFEYDQLVYGFLEDRTRPPKLKVHSDSKGIIFFAKYWVFIL